MSTSNDIVTVNQFGEKSISKVVSVGPSLSEKAPAKPGIVALELITIPDIDWATSGENFYPLVQELVNECKQQMNAILLALKAVE